MVAIVRVAGVVWLRSAAVVGIAGVALCSVVGERAVVVVPTAKAGGMALYGVYFLVGFVEVGPVCIRYQGVGHGALSEVVQAGRKRWYA